MKKVAILGILAVIALSGQTTPPYTIIQDTLIGAVSNGSQVSAEIMIRWPEFSYSGSTIPPAADRGQTWRIVNGAVRVPLVPTDHATSSVMYRVTISVDGGTATSYWSVPTLPSSQCAHSTYCTIAEVTVAYPASAPVTAQVVNLNLSATYCPSIVNNIVVMTQCSCSHELADANDATARLDAARQR